MSGRPEGGRTAFVTGSTGVVGPVVIRQLLSEGWTVRALVRRAGDPLPHGAEPIVGDLGDAAALSAGVDGADAVIHLAAILHIVDPTPDLAAMYRLVNTEGTRRLAALAEQAGVSHFAFASTINVYGPTTLGSCRTEADELRPASLYAETKAAAEGSVRDLEGGVVLRLAAVVGPGSKGNYQTLERAFRKRLRVLPGDGTNRRTLIHVDDAAAAFVLAARGAVPDGTYNLTDGHTHTFDAIARSLQVAVGRRPGVHYVPVRAVRAALRLPALALRRGPTLDGLLEKITEDVAVSGDLLIGTSPYTPRIDTLAALTSTDEPTS